MLVALWLLLTQGAMGAFDTLYFHEYKLRLPAQPHARRELQLHAFRDFVYAVLFSTIGWVTWNGLNLSARDELNRVRVNTICCQMTRGCLK